LQLLVEALASAKGSRFFIKVCREATCAGSAAPEALVEGFDNGHPPPPG
jgi:hypothetical protein